MKKITFFGDVMCEPLMLQQARQKDGSYCFDEVYKQVLPLIREADYCIANLETPLAGEEAGYTSSLFSFNTPDAFADAVKKAGISLVTTANNHCVDRGFEGLKRTVRVLEEKGLPHFGTWKAPEDRQEAAYFTVGEQRVALISCTYGTNYAVNHCSLSPEEEEHIQLLHAHSEPVYIRKELPKKSLPKRVWHKFLGLFPEETRTRILRSLGRPYNNPREDDYLDEATAAPYFARLRENMESARKKADILLFFPHVGGQFNPEPGAFTRYTFNQALEAGCQAIIASHPHIVQKAEIRQGVPCFYSIGNFSMSPNSVYLLPEHLPQYGLAVHLYLRDKKIVQTTFSILKMVENKGEMLQVWPVDRYYEGCGPEQKKQTEAEVRQIYATVTGQTLQGDPIRREYSLGEAGQA